MCGVSLCVFVCVRVCVCMGVCVYVKERAGNVLESLKENDL